MARGARLKDVGKRNLNKVVVTDQNREENPRALQLEREVESVSSNEGKRLLDATEQLKKVREELEKRARDQDILS